MRHRHLRSRRHNSRAARRRVESHEVAACAYACGVLERQHLKRLSVIAAAGIALSACSGTATTQPSADDGANSVACTNIEQIAQWPLKRRVAQVLMGAVNTDQGSQVVDQAIAAISKRKVTGVNFLGTNVAGVVGERLAEAVDAGGDVPPLLAVDEEGGQVQRLSAVTGFVPSAREMSQAMTPQQVEKQGRDIGNAMQELSLNMDFAPVVDVGSSAIGDRTFSDNPEIVTEYAGAFAEGLRKADVIPTLKHFPGLGSATGNTDFQPATTPPLNQLEKTDLIPYEFLLDDDPVTVMFSNAVVPGLTQGEPASLSPAAYTLLREDLAFDGVALTDSLTAAAISAQYSIPEAAELAISAGGDIALWDDLSQADAANARIRKAVKNDRISEDQLHTSVARVLALKGVDLCSGR